MEYQIQLVKANGEFLEYTVKESEIEEKKNKIITYKKSGGLPEVITMKIFTKTLTQEINV